MLNPDIVDVVHRELSELLDVDRDQIRMEANLNRDLGVSSMQLAELVAKLEDHFGHDPFTSTGVTSVRTVADLCQAYSRGDDADDPVEALLALTRQRAQSRRTQ